MSMPSVYFIATPQEARKVRLNHDLDEDECFECGGMESLKNSMLLAILQRKEWDVALLDDFPEVYMARSGTQWTWGIPAELIALLADADETELKRAAKEWAATEEMRCQPRDAEFLIHGMRRIALASRETGLPMFLYMSM